MIVSYAILMDGGFVRKKLGSRRTPLTGDDVRRLVERIGQALTRCGHFTGLRLHRAYFYDAKPLTEKVRHPLTGGERDLGASDLARCNRKLHKELERLPFLAVRYGRLRPRGWVLARQWVERALSSGGEPPRIEEKDVRYITGQKGVDMRIGLDMASLTLKRHVNLIVLVTGDTDFVPAMKFARREGAQVCLVRLGHGVADELLEHADLDLEVDLADEGGN